jgi:hypothetical protein
MSGRRAGAHPGDAAFAARAFAALALAGAGLAACRSGGGAGGPGAAAPPPAAGAGVERARGTVRVAGTAESPRILLVDPAGGERTLTGPRSRELARLAHAEVTVEGAPVRPAPALEVARYTVESIDGRRPVVGTLVTRAGGLALAATDSGVSDTLELVGVGAELRAHVGAAVWVTGMRSGTRLAVAAYGILREP